MPAERRRDRTGEGAGIEEGLMAVHLSYFSSTEMAGKEGVARWWPGTCGWSTEALMGSGELVRPRKGARGSVLLWRRERGGRGSWAAAGQARAAREARATEVGAEVNNGGRQRGQRLAQGSGGDRLREKACQALGRERNKSLGASDMVGRRRWAGEPWRCRCVVV